MEIAYSLLTIFLFHNLYSPNKSRLSDIFDLFQPAQLFNINSKIIVEISSELINVNQDQVKMQFTLVSTLLLIIFIYARNVFESLDLLLIFAKVMIV